MTNEQNRQVTMGEIWAARDALETDTATALGRLLFAFSRLDAALGLCLVWADDGARLHAETPRVQVLTFHRKLESLARLVDAKFEEGSRKRAAWTLWIEQAHAARLLRNQLTHGRWDVDPYTSEAINVLGLPTGNDQQETRFTLGALKEALEEIGRLQSRLWQLREQRPV